MYKIKEKDNRDLEELFLNENVLVLSRREQLQNFVCKLNKTRCLATLADNASGCWAITGNLLILRSTIGDSAEGEKAAFRASVRAGRANMGNDAIISLSFCAEPSSVEFCEFPASRFASPLFTRRIILINLYFFFWNDCSVRLLGDFGRQFSIATRTFMRHRIFTHDKCSSTIVIKM